MENNRLSEYLNKLHEKGYHEKYEEFICGQLYEIDLFGPGQKQITLGVQYDQDYLSELSDGDEYIPDFSRMWLSSAMFYCAIDYPEAKGEFEGYDHGIQLDEDYGPGLNYFWTAFEIFENPTSWKLKVMKKHLEHLEYFFNFIDPILKKYDFEEYYDTFWDTTSRESLGSNPGFSYKYKYSERDPAWSDLVSFETDLITLEFKSLSEIGEVNAADFEKKLIDNVLCYKSGIPKLMYERFFSKSPGWTPTSYLDILGLMQELRWMKENHPYSINNTINFDNIPECYKDYVDEYKQLKERNEYNNSYKFTERKNID